MKRKTAAYGVTLSPREYDFSRGKRMSHNFALIMPRIRGSEKLRPRKLLKRLFLTSLLDSAYDSP